MKRILVPTDFSTTAERALRFALDLAERSSGTVILYHVHKPVKNEFVGTIEARDMYNKQAEVNLLKKMQRLKKKVTDDNNAVSVSTVLGRTPVINNILGFAEAHSIDLIIMGTQGATGIRKTIIGTVAAKIAEQADISVMLIPGKYDWKDPKHIVFASNYSKSDKVALNILLSIAKLFKSRVTVLHLRNAYLTATEKEKIKADFDAYAFALQRDFNEYKIKFSLLDTDSVIETMENLDKKMPYDIIGMVRRKKGFYEKFFIGSFTKNMSYITKQPLLIIPEQTAVSEKNSNNDKEETFLIPSNSKIKIEKISKKKQL